MTPTPETDAQHLQFAMGGFTLDFCRKLERERDDAREEFNDAWAAMIRWMSIAEGRGRTDSLASSQQLHRAEMEYDAAVNAYHEAEGECRSSFYEHNQASYWKGRRDALRVFLPRLVSPLRAIDSAEAFKIEEKFEGQPHGWIQWKGTDVCMDIHCECGEHLHYDGDFLYEVQCPHCGQAYSVNGHVQLIPIDNPGDYVKIPDNEL